MTGEIAYKFDLPVVARAKALRLLVVEDDEIYADLVCMMALRLGVVAEKAPGWAQAAVMIEQAAREEAPYRLVLMDLLMPEVDGIEATRRLRMNGNLACDLPVIALSGLTGTREIQAFFAAGGQAALTKPLCLESLSAALEKWLVLDRADIATDGTQAASLLVRYKMRKLAAIAAIDAALAARDADKQAIAAIQDILHKLTGVAGFFGDKLLSNLASSCDAALTAAPHKDALAILEHYRSRLADAS
jgi:CheY-like chemotaxis protein